MRAHPYADRFPMLDSDELHRLADDELIRLSGGGANRHLFMFIGKDKNDPTRFRISAFSDGVESRTRRAIPIDLIPEQSTALIRDLRATDIELTHYSKCKRTEQPKSENVYFVQDVLGNIKIGYATNVRSRLANLQTANSAPLQLLGYITGDKSKEAELHREFSDARIAGEWFRPTESLMGYIEEVAQ